MFCNPNEIHPPHLMMTVPDHARMLATHTPDQFSTLPTHAWMVEDVFHSMSVILLWGGSGVGKTALLIDMVLTLACGIPWSGRNVQKGPVVYCALEGAAGFRRRVLAALEHHELDVNDDLHFIFDPVNLIREQDVIDLAKTSVTHKARLIVVDTLAASLAGVADENSNRDMTLLTHHAKLLAMMTGCAVLITHHTGRNPLQASERGAYSLRANVDVSIRLARSGNERSWEIVKARDGVDGIGGRFELVPVSASDADGTPINSVVVRHLEGGPSNDTPTRRTDSLTHNQSAVLEQFKLLLDDHERQATDRGESIWDIGIAAEDCVQACRMVVQVNDTKHRSTRTREAFQALIKHGLVLETNEHYLLPQ